MDTTNRRPAWAKHGAIVNVNGKHWTGKILDVAVSDCGIVLLQIDSPKANFMGQAPEWLIYDPKQITLGSEYDLAACANRYTHMHNTKGKLLSEWLELDVPPGAEAGNEWPDEKV